jgi:hypothetical protein
MVVVFTLTSAGQIRLISARTATRIEIRLYMNRPDELRDQGPDEDVQLDDDDVDLSTLDWSKAIRGGTFSLRRGPEWVRLEDHVRVIFQGDEEVNEALKRLIRDDSFEIDFERRFSRERAEELAAQQAAVPTAEPPKRSSAASSRRRSGRSPGSRRRS